MFDPTQILKLISGSRTPYIHVCRNNLSDIHMKKLDTKFQSYFNCFMCEATQFSFITEFNNADDSSSN